MRKTITEKPLIFDNKDDMIKKTKELIFSKFRFDLDDTLRKSTLLETLKQKKLFEF